MFWFVCLYLVVFLTPLQCEIPLRTKETSLVPFLFCILFSLRFLVSCPVWTKLGPSHHHSEYSTDNSIVSHQPAIVQLGRCQGSDNDLTWVDMEHNEGNLGHFDWREFGLFWLSYMAIQRHIQPQTSRQNIKGWLLLSWVLHWLESTIILSCVVQHY
jgi:hypothetical protein